MGDYFCGGYFRSPCGSGAFLLHPAHHGCGLPKSGVSISAFSKYGSGVRIGANRFSPGEFGWICTLTVCASAAFSASAR